MNRSAHVTGSAVTCRRARPALPDRHWLLTSSRREDPVSDPKNSRPTDSEAAPHTHETEFARELLDVVREPLLVLDRELRVVAGNRPFYATFRLEAAATEGRLIYELDNRRWDIPRLREMLECILPATGAFRDVEIEHDFEQAGKRLTVVNGRRLDRLHRILLSFEDLTERRQAEHRQWLLVAEIRHRANNILAAVSAMAARTYTSSRSLKDFWIRFHGRLQALAMAQNLATQSAQEYVGLHDLVAEELRVHAIREGDAVSVDGPEVELTGKGAEALAMTVHELTTNAIMHGALSDGDGRVDIRWTIQGGQLELEWVESGIPRVRRPRRRGFGLDIIEEGTRYTLDGEAKVRFGAHGIRCTVRFPLEPYAMAAREPDGAGRAP